MVMMALEGLERILQVGDEEARRSGCANPYVEMLSASKIEELSLETHRHANIAKRYVSRDGRGEEGGGERLLCI